VGDLASVDRLIQELDNQDRQQLLEHIRSSSIVTDVPLADPASGHAHQFDLGEEYAKLTWMQRMLMTLRATFRGAERDSLLVLHISQRIAPAVRRSYPGLIDVRRQVISGHAARELNNLVAALRPLRHAFHDALVRRRAEFVAYLVASLLPQLHRRSLAATDPERTETPEPVDLNVVRREINTQFEDTVAEIGESDRRRLYFAVVALHRFNELLQHDFDPIVSVFVREEVRFAAVRPHLVGLGNRVTAAENPPSADSVEALFLFHYGAEASATEATPGDEPDTPALLDIPTDAVAIEISPDNVQARLTADLERTNAAFEALRTFNTRFPIVAATRFVIGAVNCLPDESSGGEDWYALMRSYWRRRLKATFDRYSRKRSMRQLAVDARQLINAELPRLGNCDHASGSPETTRHSTTVGLLLGLRAEARFRSLLRQLRILLTNGEFYRSRQPRGV